MRLTKENGPEAKLFGWSRDPSRAMEHPARSRVGVRTRGGKPFLVLMFQEVDGAPGKRPRQMHVELSVDGAAAVATQILREALRLKKTLGGPSAADKLCAPLEDLLEKQFRKNGYVGVQVSDEGELPRE